MHLHRTQRHTQCLTQCLTQCHGQPAGDERVAVVGAGHAGLCVASALNDVGIVPTVYDGADQIGDSWRQRYRGLRLNTDAASSAVPGFAPSPDMGRWPLADRWADYLQAVAGEVDASWQRNRVEQIDRGRGEWLLRTRSGVHAFDVVVVATGRDRLPNLPTWPRSPGSTIEVAHSSDVDRPADLADRRVLVVGSGNSATEIAHLLVGHAAEVSISIRTRPLFVRRETLGVSITQVGRLAKYVPVPLADRGARLLQRLQFPSLDAMGLGPSDLGLDDLAHRRGPTVDDGFVDDVANGRIEVVAEVDRLDDTQVRLVDGTRLAVDTVVAATGHRPGLESFLPGDLVDARGWPIADEPPYRLTAGLYAAGFAPATLTAFMPDFADSLSLIARDIRDRLPIEVSAPSSRASPNRRP